MVTANVFKQGKTFIQIANPGAKRNSTYYCYEVLSQLLQEMEHLSNGDYIS